MVGDSGAGGWSPKGDSGAGCSSPTGDGGAGGSSLFQQSDIGQAAQAALQPALCLGKLFETSSG